MNKLILCPNYIATLIFKFMGVFNLFKRRSNSKKENLPVEYRGPTCLEGNTIPIHNSNGKTRQWQAKVISPDGNTQFKIKYYGQRHGKHENLIVGTDIAPPLIFAVHSTTGESILLFDGCRHGYNALFCDVYSDEQLNSRPAADFYMSGNRTDVFEITITTYNDIDYEDEFSDQVDASEFVELANGNKMKLDIVKRDGYGAIKISITDMNGKEIEILSEELT